MAADRIPLGDGTVHIGSEDFVANAGAVEHGGPDQGPVGLHSEGARSWALRGFGDQQTWRGDMASFPRSPGVGDLQVDPILPEINYLSTFPANDGDDAWKGIQPEKPTVVTGFDPKEL